MRLIIWAILGFFLLSCSGGTGSSPIGPAGPVGGTAPGEVGAGFGGDDSVGGNQAAEQDAGEVLSQGDPDKIVAKIICLTKSIKHNPNHPDYDPDQAAIDENRFYIEGHLGYQLNEWVPCCNGRFVRFVDGLGHKYADFEIHKVSDLDGGFEAFIETKTPISPQVFVAPEGVVSSSLDTWQACQEDPCVPDNFQEIVTPFHDPSCAPIKYYEQGNSLKYNKNIFKYPIFKFEGSSEN